VVDLVVWYEQQEALSYSLLHLAVKAAGQPIGNMKAAQDVDRAHAALLEHSRQIAGNHLPLLLAKNGVHTIPYQHLAEAQAKVQVLTAEIAQARDELATIKVEGWRPEFDAMSPRQEELVVQFCQEIAGRRGEAGSPPDPVRLLEIAQALYEAERADALSENGDAP
jgi:hypothetical protein